MNTFSRILSLLIFSCISTFYAIAQDAGTSVYFFPGQGSDARVFSNIRLDPEYRRVDITYPVPYKGATMKEYAGIIAGQIDTTGKYILIGTSLGGMICTELADILHPEKVIIISSAKCRSELPKRYTVMKNYQAYRLYPKKFIKFGALLLQPTVEKNAGTERIFFRDMLRKKDPQFLKETSSMVINWNRQTYAANIVHIHGSDDHVLNISNIKADYIVEHGTHIMSYNRGSELSEIIARVLQ